MFTQRSRGNDTINVRCAAGSMWTTIIVSERAPASAVGLPNAFSCVWFFTNERVSEPRSRKFSPLGGAAAVMSLTRGMRSTFWSMNLLTATTAPTIAIAATPSAMTKRRAKARNDATVRTHFGASSYRPVPARPGRGGATLRTVLVNPPAVVEADIACGPVVLRTNDGWVTAADPVEVVTASGPEALDRLATLTPGWWAGYLSYDLGRAVERVRPRLADDLRLPDLHLARYDARAVSGPGGQLIEACGAGARRRLAERLDSWTAHASDRLSPPALGPARSSLSRDEFEAAVRAVVALIEAGECYQVNLTRRLVWDAPADPAALFSMISRRHRGAVRVDAAAPASRR